MKLTESAWGTKVKIINMTSLTETVRRRLNDLGVMEGTIVSLCKVFPFGGPCTIESKGQGIAIRRKEAHCIQVEAV